MPPKKQSGPSKKTVEKKKDKVIEDKTFGLKNKRGKKQQQFVKQVTNQVKYGGGTSIQKREEVERKEKQLKEDEKKQKAEMESLLRPTQPQQKVSAGADPKSVLCLFFRQGQCKKGDKCKFSHDLTMEGKSEKRSMYVDKRDMEQDTMDKWDEDKLKEVVQRKHGGKMKQKTDIVCKHFLHAIEKGIYGWFWECPSGERCIYRHALPPGFVFKKIGAQTNDTEEETITIEELVENERRQLSMSGKTLTPVTLDSFKAWKERKLKEKKDKLRASADKKKEAFVAGRTHGISGREMFEFNPELVQGDDQEAGDDTNLYSGQRDGGGGEDAGGEERERDGDEGGGAGGEEGDEARDITDMVGYTDEVIPLPPPPPPPDPTVTDSTHQTQEAAAGSQEGAVGGATKETNHMTGSDVGESEEEEEEEEEEVEEVPIDEDLFAAEELENLDLEDIADIEASAVD